MLENNNAIKDIPVVDIINKYSDKEINSIESGNYISLEPCPFCGHHDCCKINLDSNTLACWGGNCKIYYQDPVQVLCRLKGIDEVEAIHILAKDYSIQLPQDFDNIYVQYKKNARKRKLMTDFAEECHKALNEEERKYYHDRGFTNEIIDTLKLGICRGNGNVYIALLSRGYSDNELRESGLFYGTREYFGITTIDSIIPFFTFPNWSKGMVIDIQGRVSPVFAEQYKSRYKNMEGTVSSLYNPDALREPIILLAEGCPDTISLMQMGYNALGAYGVGGVKDEWLPALREDKWVYICFDNDDAGRKAAYDLARKIGLNSKVATLPEDVKDINELLQKQGTEEARKILDACLESAKTYLEKDIDALPAQLNKVLSKDIKLLAEEFFRIASHQQEYYLGYIADHFGTKTTVIKNALKPFRTEVHKGNTSDTTDETDNIIINFDEYPRTYKLSQCFAFGKVFFAQYLMAKKNIDGVAIPVAVCRIITSDRKHVNHPAPLTEDAKEIILWEYEGNKLAIRRPLTESTHRWSKSTGDYSILAFIENREHKVDTMELYRKIEAIFRKHYYTKEEYDYAILTLFTMFTYYYELYDAIPYLFINGPAGSGKTSICQLLSDMTFNGDLILNASTSSLFRQAERLQMVLVLDEQEAISNSKAYDENSDYLSIIKVGYKRGGKVTRQSPNNCEITEEFEVFNPVVIANVKGLESIVKTRTIHITTALCPDSMKHQYKSIQNTDEDYINEMQMVRDMLYCWVMQNHEDLRKLPKLNVKDAASNRAGELFLPLLGLAAYIDCNDADGNLKLLDKLQEALPSKEMKRTAFYVKDMGELLREACLNLLTGRNAIGKGKELWVSTDEIIDALAELNGKKEDYMNQSWVGEKLVSMNIVRGKEDRDRRMVGVKKRDFRGQPIPGETEGKKRTCYRLKYDLVKGE